MSMGKEMESQDKVVLGRLREELKSGEEKRGDGSRERGDVLDDPGPKYGG